MGKFFGTEHYTFYYMGVGVAKMDYLAGAIGKLKTKRVISAGILSTHFSITIVGLSNWVNIQIV